jgi:2-hydroxy-6-oxonona-2,4-dienedioate hydrolase
MSPESCPQAALFALQSLELQADVHDIVMEGCRVRWRCWGQGAPLVLIHGGAGNWAHWARNIPHWSRDHALWVPDMPGFGDSDALPGPGEDAQFLHRLVQTLSASFDVLIGPEAWIDLAGFSFGGLVAGTLAVHRQKVRRLALLGTAGHGGPKRRVPELVKWRLPDRPAMLQALRDNLGQLMLHHPHSIDELAMAIHERASLATRFRSKGLSLEQDLKTTLTPFSSPILMVWGEHDMLAEPALAAARLMQGHPERHFHLIPDAGHWVQYEASERVNDLIGEWFRA